MGTIEASDPAQLKAELDSRIRQIIADRLSFSAPSITASIQEGGAIYQAQFNYEPNGEWRGNLIRKAIKPADDPDDPGGVADSPNYSDRNGKNWNAGDELVRLGSNSRNIWTALDVLMSRLRQIMFQIGTIGTKHCINKSIYYLRKQVT